MLRLAWDWAGAPLVAAVLWGAFVELLHVRGYYPDRWVAELIMRHPSEKARKATFWVLVAMAVLATLLLVNWFLPAEVSGSGININGNSGIITKGQHGDNTISK
jgi:uncharacterized membrane protein YjdF